MRLAFTVLGKAEPQGSARGFVPESWARAAVAQGKAPRAVITSDNPANKAWRKDVAYSALSAMRGTGMAPPMVDGRVVDLAVTFYLPRPKHLKGDPDHLTTPDLDKLVRSVCDALKGICWSDDKLVGQIVAAKRYAEAVTNPADPRTPGPRAEIVVSTSDV